MSFLSAYELHKLEITRGVELFFYSSSFFCKKMRTFVFLINHHLNIINSQWLNLPLKD
jgi:hypothetical protein